MKRLKSKAGPILTLMTLALTLLLPPAVAADSGPVVTGSSAEVDFPLAAVFNLTASDAAAVDDVRLHYRVVRESPVEVVSEVVVEFRPGSTIDAEYTLDMRLVGGLPPGTEMVYWWTLRDDGVTVADTTPASLFFDDGRYEWRTQTRGLVTLHWYEGDSAFARTILEAAEDALQRLEQTTGAALQRPVDLYIYDSQYALLGAMIFPQEWTGGVAYSSYNAVAIHISESNLSWGLSAVAHELAHLVVYQITDNPYLGNPLWLDEGLAISAEPSVDEYYIIALRWAVAEDELFSVRTLCSPFSAYSDLAILSYAQSWSLVKYLTDTYGQDKMLELLAVMNRGSDYDDALEEVYGFDIEGLNTLWRRYAMKEFGGNG